MWAIVISFISGALVLGGTYAVLNLVKKRSLMQSLLLELYLIKIPWPGGKQEKNPEEFKNEINKSEQLFSTLGALKVPFVLEVAVPHIGEEIHFYMAVPRPMASVAVKAVLGIWTHASVTLANDDYNIFNTEGAATAAYLQLNEDYALPIRTYMEIGADTFGSILSGFSKIAEVGEGAAMQVLAYPVEYRPKKRIQNYIDGLKRGETLEKVFRHKMPFNFKDIHDAVNVKAIEEKQAKERIVDEEAIKALQQKMSKQIFQVNARIAASAPTMLLANSILDGIAAGFSQFDAPMRNDFRIVKPRNPKKIIYNFVFRKFDYHHAMLLNSEEIASFYHLPISTTETPKVKWLKAREAEPPPDLPQTGISIGTSSFRGEVKNIFVTEDDRRRHIYTIGQTGTGKSTLLGNMILQDIKSGKGLAVIDPHGELVETALTHVPKERLDDLYLFDPGDLARPLGLNMIEYNPDHPEEKTFIVNEMQSIFNKLFLAETMGPMFEQYMRNALLLLMEDSVNEPGTLIEVPRIFTDTEFRRRKLSRINNPVVIDFWEKEAIKAGGEASLANMTPYITSKFNNFIANDYVRPVIGQYKSAFNFRQVMDEGKILLVNLSKGKIGDINANLLGMIIVGKILMAALSRVEIVDAAKRKDFYLYIDEFQNFSTDSIATILSEARKYRLDLIMAHQFIAQLEDKIKDAVFGNVGSQIVCRVGVQDAEFLVKQFEPVFDENDLVSIDNLNAYAKILINGQTAKPFNLKIGRESWQRGNNAEMVDKYKEYCRLKYGQDRKIVEQDIMRRLRV